MDLSSKKSVTNRPFYELPENKTTSSQIINEARTSLRSITTRRPFTPREDQRHLFPSTTTRTPDSRPPSSFSLNSRHFEGPDSRPVSGTRLSPLDHAPRTITDTELENILSPKPPASDPNRPQPRRSANSRHRIYTQLSIDNPASNVKDGPVPAQRSGSLTDVSAGGENPITEHPVTRAHSGPKERTYPLTLENSGITEGSGTVSNSANSVSHPHSAGSRSITESQSGSGGTKRSSAGHKRTGSSGRQDSNDTERYEVYNQRVVPILDQMAALSKRKDCEQILVLAVDLYNLLEQNNCLGKHFPHRASVLKVIFKMLDVEEPKLLLKLARLILAFRIGGNNLPNVCKLVFKVSRSEKNDNLFLEDNILNLLLDTIQNTDHVTSCEALIYCVGAVKFLTANSTILKKLAQLDSIKILANLMHKIIKSNKESGKVNDQYGHILVQLAAALRNLADTSTGRVSFIEHHVVEGLTQLMESYPGDFDLMLYISRILSKVTLHTDCCTILADQRNSYRSFVNLLKRYQRKEDVVVRLCFVLGNVTARNEKARVWLFQEKSALDVLLLVLTTYDDIDAQGVDQMSVNGSEDRLSQDGKASPNTVEDVLIKVIRVLANLSISEDVGPFIAANSEFLRKILSVIERKDVNQSEELILNCVATVNNLTFYTIRQSVLAKQHLTIAQSLLKLLLTNNMEGMLEAARVFGNLTRHKDVRDFLSENKVDAIMVTLLDSGNREVVYIACGVLINFMVDEDKRPTLKQEGGITKCIDVLRDFGQEDWQLSATVCKMLCNYSTGMTSTTNTFGHEEAQQLSDLLVEYLDKDIALDTVASKEMDNEMKEHIHDAWEKEFCPVASHLLRRIELHQSHLEPLEAPG